MQTLSPRLFSYMLGMAALSKSSDLVTYTVVDLAKWILYPFVVLRQPARFRWTQSMTFAILQDSQAYAQWRGSVVLTAMVLILPRRLSWTSAALNEKIHAPIFDKQLRNANSGEATFLLVWFEPRTTEWETLTFPLSYATKRVPFTLDTTLVFTSL